MKGKINTLDLLNLKLRFIVGLIACAGDLRQFFPSIGLNKNQWNLQRVLWREGMNLNVAVEEIVIISFIFGVRAVSALSERAVIMLAEHIKPRNPRLAEMLIIRSRFVDDIADSDMSMDVVTEKADELCQ